MWSCKVLLDLGRRFPLVRTWAALGGKRSGVDPIALPTSIGRCWSIAATGVGAWTALGSEGGALGCLKVSLKRRWLKALRALCNNFLEERFLCFTLDPCNVHGFLQILVHNGFFICW